MSPEEQINRSRVARKWNKKSWANIQLGSGSGMVWPPLPVTIHATRDSSKEFSSDSVELINFITRVSLIGTPGGGGGRETGSPSCFNSSGTELEKHVAGVLPTKLVQHAA